MGLTHRGARLLAAGTLLSAGLVAFGGLGPSTASAEIQFCNGDPTIALSNGQSISVSVSARTTPGNVTGVDYVVYVPSDVHQVGTTDFSGDIPGTNEHVTVNASLPTGHYATSVTVMVNGRSTGVATDTSVDGTSVTAHGSSGHTIDAHLTVK